MSKRERIYDSISLIVGLTIWAGLQGLIPLGDWRMPLWLAFTLIGVGGLGTYLLLRWRGSWDSASSASGRRPAARPAPRSARRHDLIE